MVRISIHAPRERSDAGKIYVSLDYVISIHAPRERSDLNIDLMIINDLISIHAPRERSDNYKGSNSIYYF